MNTSDPAIDVNLLRQHLEALLPTALDNLRQMVQVNSFTQNADGVNRVGDLTAALFESMGFTAQRPQAIVCAAAPRPPLGRHLLLTRQGTGRGRIGMVGHLDTVYTTEEEGGNDFGWRVAGDRIYGPGTMDMKGGNVMIWMVLSALQAVAPALFDQITWVVMFNAGEEGLDSDFGTLERARLGPGTLANLVFEAGACIDGVHQVIAQRKGSAGFLATARGRAAHAGAQHERGANAIVQLAEFITRISGLTDYARQLTCNVGVIRGGVVANRVPDHAEAVLEMRAYDPRVLQEAVDKALALDGLSTVASAADGYRTRLEVYCRKRLPAWPDNPGTTGLIKLWQDAGRAMGVGVAGRSRGGLSDGNFTYDLVPTLDGLGPIGGNPHCSVRSDDGTIDQEYVLPATFVPRAMLNVLGIERLAARQPVHDPLAPHHE